MQIMKHFETKFCEPTFYKGLFMSVIAFSTVALLTISQATPFLYDKEVDAESQRYNLEQKTSTQITTKQTAVI